MNNLIFHTFRFYFETVFKYLSAPVYVFVAQWDSYQLQELVHSKFPTMRLPPELPSEAEYLGKFGKNTHRSLRRVGILRKKASFDNWRVTIWMWAICSNFVKCFAASNTSPDKLTRELMRFFSCFAGYQQPKRWRFFACLFHAFIFRGQCHLYVVYTGL